MERSPFFDDEEWTMHSLGERPPLEVTDALSLINDMYMRGDADTATFLHDAWRAGDEWADEALRRMINRLSD
jgi:hypothetical protein